MGIPDTQRSRVHAAEDAVLPYDWAPADPSRYLRGLIVWPSREKLTVRATGAIYAPLGTKRVTLLAAAAHVHNPLVFPTHGAEYVDLWTRMVAFRDLEMYIRLARELDRRKVQRHAELRPVRVHLTASHLANSDIGAQVEVVTDHPPQRILGPLLGYDKKTRTIHVGDMQIDGRRAHYIAKVGEQWPTT